MSNLMDFFGGGGGLINPNDYNIVTITTSQTWTAPDTATYYVVAQGGGGGGGVGNGGDYIAGGGWAGGIATGVFNFNSGDTVDITIGAGGAGNASGDGYAGGDTTFGTYITSIGGHGGVQYDYKKQTPNKHFDCVFFGVLEIHTMSGASSNIEAGGEAGIGGNGGDYRADGGKGAGGGAGKNSDYPPGNGGDGIVYIIWEKQS